MRSNMLLAGAAALILASAGGAFAIAQDTAAAQSAAKDAKASATDAKNASTVAKKKAKVAVKKAAVADKKAGQAEKAAMTDAQKEALIKDRVDFMKAQAADNKAIGDYAKGMATKEQVTKAINDLIDRSAKIPDMFPAGTSSKEFPGKSYAKPDIWSDYDRFAGIAKTLHELATKEAELIKTGTPEDVGKAQAELGKNGCGGCHGPFREKLPG